MSTLPVLQGMIGLWETVVLLLLLGVPLLLGVAAVGIALFLVRRSSRQRPSPPTHLPPNK